MGIINDFFGAMLNLIFEGVVAVSPVATLGISIVIFTLVTRLLLTPLQLSSQRTSRGMSKLQPEMQRIQNKYKNKKDQESQLQYSNEMKALYKTYKINPLAGCLPLLIQFPLIIALFNVLREPARYIRILGEQYSNIAKTIISNVPNYQELLEGFKKAVQTTSRVEYDITQSDQLGNFLSHLNSSQWQEFLSQVNVDARPLLEQTLKAKEQFEVFLGVNLIDTPSLLIKGGMWLALLVPLIAGASTYIFSKITMASSAAMQQSATNADGTKQVNTTESMMKTMNIMMPVMTGMFSYTMPIGLAVYWISGNIIMMGQQWFVNKIVVKQEAKLEEKIKKEREEEARAKKLVKKKVIKKVPVQKKTTEENESIQNESNKQ
ncbi:YidC/Oxa1 family membrane protein insertase [Cellulosilyticum sp. I15G10I2]|uniref:YidC/Oxa1 family membrane protein insertase n=1 Tax=Cellulosilyticum sp. I15G10I2 TaxID=1892843 RepID=UPI00085C0026|nr:YidC/Oxa1 family membrane protein insertase [Cellulosilyticum sp. I15G10I2]